LSMISGAGSDHAALAFGLTEGEEFVESTALLEGACALQVFELQMNRETDQFRKVMGILAGRNMDRFTDTCTRGLDAN